MMQSGRGGSTRTNDAEPSSMAGGVVKWSIKKAPDQDAVRVRNNQRRHRERAKQYVADLEARVKALEGQLEFANGRVHELTVEVMSLRDAKTVEEPRDHELHQMIHNTGSYSSLAEPQQIPTQANTTASPESSRPNSGSRCCVRNPQNAADPEVSDGEDLPDLQPGESTTTCKEAFQILRQQSGDGLDVDEAEEYLRAGFRRASQRGDGCRVQTRLVYDLIDHITEGQR